MDRQRSSKNIKKYQTIGVLLYGKLLNAVQSGNILPELVLPESCWNDNFCWNVISVRETIKI